MAARDQLPLQVEPIISWPRTAKVGKSYLVTIDLRCAPHSVWPFGDEEEVTVRCMLETAPLFVNKPLTEPAVVLHRFGGTYGPARYLLTAAAHEMNGRIWLTLSNRWNVPVQVIDLEASIRSAGTQGEAGVVMVEAPAAAAPTEVGREDTGLPDGLQRESAGLGDYAWAVLADQVREGNVTPVIGPLLARGILGSREDIARRWVRNSAVPLLAQSQGDLAQVAQYVRVRDGDEEIGSTAPSKPGVRTQLQWQLREQIRRRRDGRGQDPTWDLEDWLVAGADPSPAIMEVGRRLRMNDPDDPYRILADLNTRVYVTTDWTDLLQAALRDNGRTPVTMAFNWKGPEGPRARPERPTEERPFVYHLFGRLDDLSSLVLSEDDYFAWLYAWAIRHGKSVPPSVLEALAGKHLLFLGYPLDDWDSRVVFQSIWNLGGSALLRRNQHFGVQSTRESQMFERTAVKEYMESYFGRANVSIYWGETREFLSRLRTLARRLEEKAETGVPTDRALQLPEREREAVDGSTNEAGPVRTKAPSAPTEVGREDTGLPDGLQRESAGLGDYAWAVLADQVREGNVTPVIGPLLARGILGSREDIARRWVRDSAVPLSSAEPG